MANKWKITAIIFIVLFIIETIGVLWLLNLGTNIIEQEEICAYDICKLDGYSDYDAYSYNQYSEICSCFKNGVEELQKFIGR